MHQEIEIKRIIADIDPIGIAASVPDDEFDTIVLAILKLNMDNDSKLATKIQHIFEKSFGSDLVSNTDAFKKMAAKIRELKH